MLVICLPVYISVYSVANGSTWFSFFIIVCFSCKHKMFDTKFSWIKWNLFKLSSIDERFIVRQIFRKKSCFYFIKKCTLFGCKWVQCKSRFIWHFKGAISESEYSEKIILYKYETKCILTSIINIDNFQKFLLYM